MCWGWQNTFQSLCCCSPCAHALQAEPLDALLPTVHMGPMDVCASVAALPCHSIVAAVTCMFGFKEGTTRSYMTYGEGVKPIRCAVRRCTEAPCRQAMGAWMWPSKCSGQTCAAQWAWICTSCAALRSCCAGCPRFASQLLACNHLLALTRSHVHLSMVQLVVVHLLGTCHAANPKVFEHINMVRRMVAGMALLVNAPTSACKVPDLVLLTRTFAARR